MIDRLVIAGLEVFAHHGVLAEEKQEGQLFVVDLDLSLDLSTAGQSDDLTQTVDYGSLSQEVHDVVASERWDLIEKVAERVAAVVLNRSGVTEVKVRVHKPHAPIPVPFGDVFVELVRSR